MTKYPKLNRRFGKRSYKCTMGYDNKSIANIAADNVRKRGGLARIVKVGNKYWLYKRITRV